MIEGIDEPQAQVFDMESFRKREDEVIAARGAGNGPKPELERATAESVHERLAEIGAFSILAFRIAKELGDNFDNSELSEVLRIRNGLMRRLIKLGLAPSAVERAEQMWEEQTLVNSEQEKQEE